MPVTFIFGTTLFVYDAIRSNVSNKSTVAWDAIQER
jgi:hypothetical protein